MNSFKMFVGIVCVFSVLFVSSVFGGSASDELAKTVPSGTSAFVIFEGTDNTQEAFDKTTLGKVWNTPSVQTFYEAIRDEIIKQANPSAELDEEQQKLFDKIKDNAGLLTSRPMLLGADISGENFYLVIQAGGKKPQMAELITQLEQLTEDVEIKPVEIGGKQFKKIEEDGLAVYWGWNKDVFMLFSDDEDMKLSKELLSGSSGASSRIFSGFDHVDSAMPFISANINIKEILGYLRDDIEDEERKEFDTYSDELGFSNIENIAFRAGLKDADILAESRIRTSGTPKGLLGLGRPVDIDNLNRLHGSSMDAAAFNYDWNKCYALIAGLIKKLEPDAFIEMANGIAETEAELGIKINGVLPDCFVGPVTVNVLPPGYVPGSAQASFTITADLRKSEALGKTLIALGDYYANHSEGMLQVASEQMGEISYHTWVAMPLAMMQLMPTWTIVDDKLVISSSKEMCIDSVSRLTAEKIAADSLGNVAAYQDAMKQIPNDVWVCRYVDTETKTKSAMTSMQSFWPMFTMGLMQEGINLPSMLPNIDKAIKDAPASFQYYYTDYSGICSYYQGFGLDINSGLGGGAGGGAMMAAILAPALSKTNRISERVVSGANLKGLGTACMVYAFDHDDEFPPNLEALIDECDVSPKSLESPIKPNGFDGLGYIYIAGQNANSDIRNILAYENPAYQTEGTNVLYVDGHASYVEPEVFLRELKETYERLKRPMPKVEFGTFEY